jgi:uncharacterized protein YPO0396
MSEYNIRQAQMFSAREQFRMCRLQVFNWGTFDKLHTITIAPKGFLFVGRSGSGKTTLLDAITALLVPPKWIHFNAAAQDNERRGRDRNLVTYVRGAWAEQKDSGSGEVATQYLRIGTVWSSIALTFRASADRVVTLAQIFWIRGSSNSTSDVRRHFMILERSFDLAELSNFDLDIRRLKQVLTEAHHFDQFSPYCERFRRLLEIESEVSLRLLHKTQSAKNLGDLNVFLRDFMLEQPHTFDVADRLVNEFGELNEAHQAVVTAREQVDMLAPTRLAYDRYQEAFTERIGLENLRSAIDPYRNIKHANLLEARLLQLQIRAAGIDGEISVQRRDIENQKLSIHDLEEQHRQLGGSQIERLESERKNLEEQRDQRLRRRAQLQDACRNLGWTLPDSPGGFAELTAQARNEIDKWQRQSQGLRDEMIKLAGLRHAAETEFTTVAREVEALRRQPTNIPADMLALRSEVAKAIGLSENELPFVGELIEVKPDESPWRGAIERVLRNFGLSILVDERNYVALSNHVNSVYLGKRLVYFRTKPETTRDKSFDIDSLTRKLILKDSPHKSWLEAELQLRFDYSCVDNLMTFKQREKAVTRQGLVKHGKTRHEKDDRRNVDDPRSWILGFDNRDKRERFEKQAHELAETISQLNATISKSNDSEQLQNRRAMSCQSVANMEWREIDVTPLEDRVAQIERARAELAEGNIALQEIGERLRKQRETLTSAEDRLQVRLVEAKQVSANLHECTERLAELRVRAYTVNLSDTHRQTLDDRLDSLREPVTFENLDKQIGMVDRAIGESIRALENEQHKLEKDIERQFAEFKRRWPMEAADVDTTLASAPDYLAKLKRLEVDGLPGHEKRFFDLLQTQSHQNLASLSTHLQQAQREIRDRMELVNESLEKAEFNTGTYLRIEVTDRQLIEVREFKLDIKQVLSHAYTDDREIAEKRFVVLKRLVDRLASQDAEDRRWRDAVLDVRLHVEFIGRELDMNGNEVEVYRSGAGKSGGQRQKLATTCLAAALRYQLSGGDEEVPAYAPVVLDEAFDKADNEFTALAMNIFRNFGFQMIVATPLKSVMTLEPFIGGACFVDISDRQRSSTLMIEYDEEKQLLDLPGRGHDGYSVAAT